MPGLRALTGLIAVWLLIVSAGGGAYARDVIPVPFEPINLDILKKAERIQSRSPETEVEASPDATGAISTMRLSAISKGPNYRWVVFSLRNASPIPLEYVVVAQRKSFVGSGVIWPEYGTRMLVDAQASPGLPPTSEQTRTADAYSFRIESNQTITYAFEVAGPWPDNLNIWRRDAFDQQRQQVSFFHGLLLGIATLVSIYISSLFIIRRKLVFPSAALFSWCSTAFLAIEFGYLPVLIDVPIAFEYKIRAVMEALTAFGLLACLHTFVELRKRMPVTGYLMIAVIVGVAGLVGYAYTEPEIGAGISRIVVLLGAMLGMLIVLTLSRRGVIRAQVAVSSWVLITLWSILAAVGALGIIDSDLIGPGLAAGLVLVNLMIAFTVTQYAFDAGVISSRFFEDSGRRALALAGSEQCVWDWREDQGWLYVGPELEPALGIKRGSLITAGLKGWLELMHPGDRPAYVAAVEAAIQRGRGTFSQEFRLRRKDGTYRWYQLRARAIPGEQGRASRCIGTLADITTLKRSEERMLYDAVQDRLTGLPNRALFMDRLDRVMRRAQADESTRLFIAVVDIDRFKNVNDGLGHSIGDSLLLTMARRLQKFVGPEDTLARLSGDQFGLIVNAANPERKMHELTEQLRQAIARPVDLNPREVFLTASIGVAEYLRDMVQAADVLKDAEIALYEAKRRGKNKIEFFRPTMRDDRSKLIEIESDLRRALERSEIEVAYQPIYNLAIDKLAGFEALVRWRHKKHGLLGPDEFIGIAEETGIIVDLGRYVLSEAARQLGIWQRVLRPSEPIFVSVNLSTRQVLDQSLVDDVKTIMSREDIVRGSLKLELTETLVMENMELSAQVLRKLNDIGVAILCDDFGTGYSSLANLQRFSFDTLKIDKSFIQADPEDDGAAIILESIIILAHDLGMRVVAEGIENREQLERLREFECDYAQGFYFGEPLTARAVVEALGGKPHMFEQKRSRNTRGFLGKLMRSGAVVPEEDEAPVRSKLKTDPAGAARFTRPTPEPEVMRSSRPDAPPPSEPPAYPPADRTPSQPPAATGPERREEPAPPAERQEIEAEPQPETAAEPEAAPRTEPQPAPAAEDLQAEEPEPKRGWFFRRKRKAEPDEAHEETVAAAEADDAVEPTASDTVAPSDETPAAEAPTAREPAIQPQPGNGDAPQAPSAMAKARERMAMRTLPDLPGQKESTDAPAAEEAPQQDDAHQADAEPSASAEEAASALQAGEPERTQPKAPEAEQQPADAPEPAPQPVAETAERKDDDAAAPEMDGRDVAAAASALSAARQGGKADFAASEEAALATPQSRPEGDAEPRAEETDSEDQVDELEDDAREDANASQNDPERQIEELASGRKRSSKLAKLLRRSKKSPTTAEP